MILISETCVDRCKILADRLALFIFPCKLFDYGLRFGTFSGNRVTVSEIAERPSLSPGQLDCLLKLRDGFWVAPFLQICQT